MRLFHGTACPQAALLLAAVYCLFGHSTPGRAEDVTTANLTPAAQPAPALVKVVYEVDGKLLSSPPKPGAEPRQHDLKAVGNFLYEERFLDLARRQTLRYYREARADLSTSGRASAVELRPERRYIAVEPEQTAPLYRALQGPLSRSELELIEIPGGSSWVDQLLTGRVTKVGEKWTHADALLASLFNLESVTANDLHSQLVAVAGDEAQLELNGKVVGSAAGVVTELNVQGKYTYHVQQQRVTWLALGIQEDRAVGLATPGLKVQARVRMMLQPDATPQLESPELPAILSGAPAANDLLEYRNENGTLSFVHDRNWHLYAERSDLIVFRRIVDGQVVAQCNLKRLPPLSIGQSIKMEQFQQEIRSALGAAVQQVVDAQETKTPQGLRQLRVALVGQVAGTPVHWIYYQVSDGDGRRVTCVFTMSGEEVARFGAEDIQLVSTMTLSEPAAPAETKAVAQQPTEPSIR